MISKKTAQIRQDLSEIKDKLEILKPLVNKSKEFKNLVEWYETLEQHLLDHIETIENFVSDLN